MVGWATGVISDATTTNTRGCFIGEQIEWYRDLLGVENLMLFPMMPGDSYTAVEDQLGRLATDVLPRFS